MHQLVSLPRMVTGDTEMDPQPVALRQATHMARHLASVSVRAEIFNPAILIW